MTLPQKLRRLMTTSPRTGVDVSDETARANKAERPNSPPPPYTEYPYQSYNKHASSSSSMPFRRHKYNRHTTHHPAAIRIQDPPHPDNTHYPILSRQIEFSISDRSYNLQSVLVEIVAVTFGVDYTQTLKVPTPLPVAPDLTRLLRAFLDTEPESVKIFESEKCGDQTSTWTESGQLLMTEICNLVRYLQSEMAQNRWLLVHPKDKLLVKRMVLEPIQDLELDLEFVLELMGRYHRKVGCCHPESTLLSFWWTASPRATDLGDAVASHNLLLRMLPLHQDVRQVLEDYVAAFIAAFRETDESKQLCTSKELQEEWLAPGKMCFWPLSEEYTDLARGLRGMEASCIIHDPYEASRTRLRAKRRSEKSDI